MARRGWTLCLPADKDTYPEVVADLARFRSWLDTTFRTCPELFPKGYRLQDGSTSLQAGVRLPRIRLKAIGESFTVRPSHLLPYSVGTTDDAQGPLFLRAFGVPFGALARVFGKNAMYWYRLEVSLGRNSIVGATVPRAELPVPLLADEHHQTRDGDKNYIATTVGEGCCLGAALAPTANADDLTAAYGVFQEEARDVHKEYKPRTVRADGWASTHQAWRALFPLVVLRRCFLHGWLNIRSRGKLGATFTELSARVWEAYPAPERRCFGPRLRRLWEWAQGQSLSAWLWEQVQKLCGRGREYGVAYAHPGGHRTSNLLDRVRRSMSRSFEDGQHLHGSAESCGLHVRAWALVPNFRPWGPEAVPANKGWHSPAERRNGHRYHNDWLQNLLVSASLGGDRRGFTPPQTPGWSAKRELAALLNLAPSAIPPFVRRHRLGAVGSGKARRFPRATAEALAALRRRGASVRTANFYLAAVKHFLNWMVRDRRLLDNPLAHLAAGNENVDRRHDRRELEADELRRLLAAARDSARPFRGLTGFDRYHLYATACGTGFRASALASLTPESFDLVGETPTVTLAAQHAKNRKTKVQPIPPDLCELQRGYLAGKLAGRSGAGRERGHAAASRCCGPTWRRPASPTSWRGRTAPCTPTSTR